MFPDSNFSPTQASAPASHTTSFKDIPATAWFASAIQILQTKGIISGYKDSKGNPTGLFKPENKVTIAESLKMALLSSGNLPDPAGKSLNRSANNTWAEQYTAAAEKLQLSLPKDVHRPATREEVFSFLTHLFNIPAPSGHETERLIALGIVKGDTAPDGHLLGTIRPKDPVNRAEMAILIVRMLTYKAQN
jgi:hypothetical protein